MDNIVSVTELLPSYGIAKLAGDLAARVKARRLELNLTQSALAQRSGVRLGTLKRFERFGAISLKHLLMLAVVLQSAEDFKQLFAGRQYSSIDEVINAGTAKNRKRGRVND